MYKYHGNVATLYNLYIQHWEIYNIVDTNNYLQGKNNVFCFGINTESVENTHKTGPNYIWTRLSLITVKSIIQHLLNYLSINFFRLVWSNLFKILYFIVFSLVTHNTLLINEIIINNDIQKFLCVVCFLKKIKFIF